MNHFVVGFVVGIVLSVIGTMWGSAELIHTLYRDFIGHSIGGIRQLKEQCEAELPRNKVCVGKVEFVVKED